MTIARSIGTAALLLASAGMAWPAQNAGQSTIVQSAHSDSGKQAEGKKELQAKSRAEFEAYQAAISETDPEKMEAEATEFAERYAASDLRPFLFQRAMGLYEQANDPAKSLQMARDVLKFDPLNAVALLTAAQMLVDGTVDHALDRDPRFFEAASDAESALEHAREITQPSDMSEDEFSQTVEQLRGAAHEVLGTIAYKKRDYVKAVKEYDEAATDKKAHTDPLIWLRLAVCHEKSGFYEVSMADAERAIAGSAASSQVHELAEKEKARVGQRTAGRPTQGQSGVSPAPGASGETN